MFYMQIRVATLSETYLFSTARMGETLFLNIIATFAYVYVSSNLALLCVGQTLRYSKPCVIMSVKCKLLMD